MIKNKNVRMYETLAHEVAMDAAVRRELTAEQREDSRRLLAYAQQRLAALPPLEAQRPKVRSWIVALQRPGLLERLGEILATQPRAVFAHRDFSSVSDDDLRSALEEAESMLERMV